MAEPLLPFIETHISFPNNFAHVRACTFTYFFSPETNGFTPAA